MAGSASAMNLDSVLCSQDVFVIRAYFELRHGSGSGRVKVRVRVRVRIRLSYSRGSR
jgi:hypothetical protein